MTFVAAIRDLASEDFSKWENGNLKAYLEAVARAVEDHEARLDHGRVLFPEDTPFPKDFNWAAAFDIFTLGKYYE
jgi:hypothetical protein